MQSAIMFITELFISRFHAGNVVPTVVVPATYNPNLSKIRLGFILLYEKVCTYMTVPYKQFAMINNFCF